jgi:tRNA pseudouridine-54 N-methylase
MLPQAPPEGDFLLKDLPGSGKRIDILCRDLAACFDWAPVSWSKSQLEIIAVIGNKKTLTFREPKEQIPRGEVELHPVMLKLLMKHWMMWCRNWYNPRSLKSGS